MHRRTFIAGGAGGLLAAPLTAEAQRRKTPVIRIRLRTFAVSSPEEIPGAFRAMAQDGAGAVLMLADPLVLDPHSACSAALALRDRLPAFLGRPSPATMAA